MSPEDVERIEATHRASVAWLNGAVMWQCLCGNDWPCRLLRLADDARRQQHQGRP